MRKKWKVSNCCRSLIGVLAFIAIVFGLLDDSTRAQDGTSKRRAAKQSDSDRYDTLLKSADSFIHSNLEKGFSGVALIADRDKIIFHKAYSAPGDGIKVDTAYGIASQAKSLTAIAIMQLHERGKLSINDPISKHFKNVPSDKKGIEIRQLLSHTSGLDECDCLDGETDQERLVNRIWQTKLAEGAGSKWLYRNENYYLLGLIVEEVSRMTFRNYVQRNILDVAGMRHTGQSGQQKEKRVTYAPIDLESLKKLPVFSKNYENGLVKANLVGRRLGGYFSTSGDMFRLALALRKNKLISASTLKMSLQPQTSGFLREGLFSGYGWFFTIKGGKLDSIFNSGREDWMMNSRMYMLENGITIVVWSRDTLGPDADAAATVVSLKLVEMFEGIKPM
jgi:CubicO group peptidase (beta-lactamase class C family)